MKKNIANRWDVAIACAATAIVSGFIFSLSALAFNGPSQTPPSGSGILSAGTSSDIAFGTQTPSSSVTVLIVGSTTNSSAYGLDVLNSAQTTLLSVRNDGVVSVGTSTISGGSFAGTVTAGNISSGQFGSNTGGGNYSFPAGLTATSGTTALASTTVTGSLTENGSAVSTSTPSSLAGAYLSVSGNSVTVSSTLASSSVAFVFQNATTTAPAFQEIQTPNGKTITNVNCFEYASATTTIELYYNTTNASTGIQQVILSSIACGKGGTSTTSFTTSTLPAGAYLFAIVSATAGTPTLTTLNVQATKF